MGKPETPLLTVDAVIDYGGRIVLVERKNYPHGLALPGGFVEVGEKVSEAVVREVKEETSLDVKIEGVLGIYSDPKRDPRGHAVTIVFVCKADPNQKLSGGDDAKRALAFSHGEIPFEKIVFDHSQIIKDYLEWKKDKKKVFVR